MSVKSKVYIVKNHILSRSEHTFKSKYLPTYIPTYIPTYLPTFLPTYLPTHPSIH